MSSEFLINTIFPARVTMLSKFASNVVAAFGDVDFQQLFNDDRFCIEIIS